MKGVCFNLKVVALGDEWLRRSMAGRQHELLCVEHRVARHCVGGATLTKGEEN